ncbi:MAG: hypoxanthine phosphoribosyltransferase [Deltaproteobacteria bacterium]|nr:hypoxanthine phosphoribosyltransferase [Deltaproteobacteria bacterium]
MVLEKELLFSRSDIQKRVKELGEQLSSDYAGKDPLFVGVLNGVVFFFADLMREISIPVKIDFMRAASYGSRMTSSGEIQITKDVEKPIRDRHVVLVEDIVDTGNTLAFVLKQMNEKDPASLKVCALMDKVERRQEEVTIDYAGFTIDSGFVVGYGLDYNEEYRNLPEIYVLKP